MLHSRLGPSERRRQWLAAASGEAQLIVGTRLAVFAPAPHLGLIVVDEEHDASFKQHEGVRYHARDVAVYRASRRDVPVILGSATPSLETYAQAMRGRYRWLKLPLRATAQTALPPVRLVPTRAEGTIEGIGPSLREAIGARLARGEQSLLFINRRGYAPALLCPGCGWKASCPRCAARLVVHRETAGLRCHHCGHAEALPHACPDCGNQDLLPQGSGTQRLERALADLYPAARILRIDRDSTQGKRTFATMREAVDAGEVDILVGTQMLAKGHDFARLTLVGVLGADNALYSGEFRATERLFALLEQVAGRAGRRDLPGEVLVQTDFPRASAVPGARRPRFRPLRGDAARRARVSGSAAVRASGAVAGRGPIARTAAGIPRRGVAAWPGARRRGGRCMRGVFSDPRGAAAPGRIGARAGAGAKPRSRRAAGVSAALARSARAIGRTESAVDARRRSARIRLKRTLKAATGRAL